MKKNNLNKIHENIRKLELEIGSKHIKLEALKEERKKFLQKENKRSLEDIRESADTE